MKIKFNSSQFNYRIGVLFSFLISWIGFIILPILVFLVFNFLPNEMSLNPLALNRPMDYFFTFIWFFSGIFPIFLVNICWNKPIFRYISTFSLFSVSMFVASIVPFFVKQTEKPSTTLVREFVSNTHLFFLILVISMILFYTITIFLIQPILLKSPWWAFIYSLPYLFTLFKLNIRKNQFNELVQSKDFNYHIVNRMVSRFTNEPLSSINPLWFEVIALSMAVLILTVGGVVSVIFWQKTKTWRKKEEEKKEI